MLEGVGMENLKGGSLPSELSGRKIADGGLHIIKHSHEYCPLLEAGFKVSAWNTLHSSHMHAVSFC